MKAWATDLNEELIRMLGSKVPHKDLANRVANILTIEKDAAYRRLSGKVPFSAREAGMLARELNINLDRLLSKDEELVWTHFRLTYPLNGGSIDSLIDMMDFYISKVGHVTNDPSECGNIYCALPMEYYLYSPVLAKFMFFKWGHNFIGTEEYNDYAGWEIPSRMDGLLGRVKGSFRFEKNYYIWDESNIWNIVREVENFHTMQIITTKEKDEIKYWLKDMMARLEQCLNGTYIPTVGVSPDSSFYLLPFHIGVTASYTFSDTNHAMILMSHNNFSIIENDIETFNKWKSWMDSYKKVSTLLSRSGHIERRVFFKKQQKIIDTIL